MPGQSWPGGASGASRSWSSRTDRRFSAVHSLETASSRVARIIGAIIVTTGLLIIAVTLLPALRA
jgi:hypothetical protein